MKVRITSSVKYRIFTVREMHVILDFDLAELYKVSTKSLNQAVHRNRDRFPSDFMFRLRKDEWKILRSQFVTSSWGGSRYLPFAFTEHGVSMLAGLLKSRTAVRMNISIIRTFVALRKLSMEHLDIQQRIDELEKKYDLKFSSISQALDFLLSEKVLEQNQNNRRRIGFKSKLA